MKVHRLCFADANILLRLYYTYQFIELADLFLLLFIFPTQINIQINILISLKFALHG